MTPRPPTRKPPREPRKKVWQPAQVKTGKLFESNSLSCNKTLPEVNCLDNPPPTTS